MFSKTAKRAAQALIGSAIVFLFLGIGNMIFASSKLANYREILDGALQEAAVKDKSSRRQSLAALKQPSRFLPGPNNDQQAQHIHRLRLRIDFYDLVRTGGKIFVGFAALLALVGVAFRRGMGKS